MNNKEINNDNISRAESALLLRAILREYEKPEEERSDVFVKKCSDLLTSADEENRGPEALKQSLMKAAREKESTGTATDPKKRKAKIIRTALIAAAVVALLATGAFSMTRIIPYYANHNVIDMEEYKEALDDPDKQIDQDEAERLAYEFALKTYGDLTKDFSVRDVTPPLFGGNVPKDFEIRIPLYWTVFLAREYKAKDFTVYGPDCTVNVYINGEVGLCICDDDEGVDLQPLVGDLSTEYLEELINAERVERGGEESVRYSVHSIAYNSGPSVPTLMITAAPSESTDPWVGPGYLFYDYDLKTGKLNPATYGELSDPDARITRDEAIEEAYRAIAGRQGDRYNDLHVVYADVEDNPLSEGKIWVIYLAKEYDAKDFKVYGPRLIVTLHPGGELNSWGFKDADDSEDNIIRSIADVSYEDIEKFVAEQTDDGEAEYEIKDIFYSNENSLRIEVRLGTETVEYSYQLEP